jgi:hypothetical protein
VRDAVKNDRLFVQAAMAGMSLVRTDAVLNNWLPLTYALNAVNRSMGLDDLYPFTLADAVIEKLRFAHARVQEHARSMVV